MKEVARKLTITYRWRKSGEEDIKENHIEALEETAQERIFAMMAEGYTSGELVDNIRMDAEDPEDGVEYSGWWNLDQTTIID